MNFIYGSSEKGTKEGREGERHGEKDPGGCRSGAVRGDPFLCRRRGIDIRGHREKR